MKTKATLFVVLGLFILVVSCKKDEQKINNVDETVLNVSVEGAVQISTGVQTFMLSSMSVAADSGFYADVPDVDSKKKTIASKYGYDYSWSGPDVDGWYTRSMSGTYDYYERVRFRDTIDYIMEISYHGADGTYENTTTTKYIKYTENQKVLFKGFSNWELYCSGYSDISRVNWKITFDDWDPESSAGTYDWYWGVSENSGGNTVPYHRFEHLIVTETNNEWLHCHATFYDEGNMETWDFEYDSPWAPVAMPDLPEVN